MTKTHWYAPLSDEQLQAVDAACEAFEHALQNGQPLRMEDCLAAVAEEIRGPLFRELLAIELDRHLPGDRRGQVAVYCARFPDRTDDIARVFEEISTLDDEPRKMLGRTGPESGAVAVSVPGYEIEEVLGRGGMGVIYKARHLQLKRTVALKMMLAGGHASPRELARFRIEAESVARLAHPNIVQIHEVGEAGGYPYCALEFVEGGNLAGRLDGKPMAPHEAAKLVETLARAMLFAHSRNVVHRDLKPANILLAVGQAFQPDTGVRLESLTYIPKITDFGLARQIDSDSGATQTGAVMGTPAYMAPEQASGRTNEAGPAADVYALGAILYHSLTGRPPFLGTPVQTLDQVRTQEPAPPSRWQKGVPLDLETICLKCLRKEPEKRYAAAELADELVRFQQGEPILARPVGSVERTWRWCKRNSAVAALVVAVAASLLVGALAASYFAYQANHRAEAEAKARQDADDEKVAALRQQDKAERMSAVMTLLRVASMYESDPGGARALLDDAGAIRADLRDPAWGFYWNICQRKVRDLPGHAKGVLAVAWSPDGELLATAGLDGAIRLSHVRTGKEKSTLRGRSWIAAVSFSPDGKTLASAGKDSTISLWDVTTGKEQATLKGHAKAVQSLAWSGDGKTLASGGDDRTVRLWDPTTGTERASLACGLGVLSVAWSPDGVTLASGGGVNGKPGELKLWDARTGKLRATLQGHLEKVHAVAWSNDSTTVAAADYQSQIRLWDATSGTALAMLAGHDRGIYSLAWSADGTTLASAGADKTVKLWEVARRRERASLNGHALSVRALAFSPDSKMLASASDDGAVKLWLACAESERSFLQGHTGAIPALSLSRDGKILASGSVDGWIKLWDLATSKNIATLRATEGLWSLALSPDGTMLASASGAQVWPAQITKPGELKLWDVASGMERHQLAGHPRSSVQSVAFSPDGKTLASGSGDATIKLWDAVSGAERATFVGHTQPVWAVAFSPDGTMLASVSHDMTVKMWDVATGTTRATLRGHTSWLTTVAWSANGKTLASAAWDQTILLWDVASGTNIRTINAHNGAVSGLAWGPDSTTLASSCFADRTLKLWDVASGQARATLKSSAGIRGLAWSTDGKTLVTGEGTLVKLWDLDFAPAAITATNR